MMADDDFERETLRRAIDGDPKAGMTALRLCRDGLDHGNISQALGRYLAERLTDVLEGVSSDRALCIEPEKSMGRPRDPFPKWKEHLGAFAAVLAQRGYRPQQIARALCEARAVVDDKPLEESDAHRIRKIFDPMKRVDDDVLIELHIGPYWGKLAEFPPLK